MKTKESTKKSATNTKARGSSESGGRIVNRLAMKLRVHMQTLEIRQTELAKMAGISDSTLVLVLTGGKARIDTVEKILVAIGKPWQWLD